MGTHELMKSQNNLSLLSSLSSRSSKRCFSSWVSLPRCHVLPYNLSSNFLLRKQSALARFSPCRFIHLKTCLFLLLYSNKFLFLSAHLLTDIVLFAVFLFSNFPCPIHWKYLSQPSLPAKFLTVTEPYFCLSLTTVGTDIFASSSLDVSPTLVI